MACLLIVDDDEDFVQAATKVLAAVGHEVHVALDTGSALASMERKRPDLVILDVMFPENAGAGFDLARTIRNRQDDLQRIPILMLTAVNMKYPLGFSSFDIDDRWLPVSDFLEKPADFDTLTRKVACLARSA